MALIRKRCMLCGNPSEVEIPDEAYGRWTRGEFIQDAWPEGSLADRETLISGSHGTCFDEMFATGPI